MAKKGPAVTPEEMNKRNREFWADPAHQWEASTIAIAESLSLEMAKRKRGAATGGKATAKARKAGVLKWHAECAARARKLLEQGRSFHELAGILAAQFDVSDRQVRTVLQSEGVLKKRDNSKKRK